jgi:transcriptional regulator
VVLERAGGADVELRRRACLRPAAGGGGAAFLEEVLDALVQRYEAHRVEAWGMDRLPPEYRSRALSAVVGIRMPVLRLEAKFKLGQNRAAADRSRTILGLEHEGSADATSLAMFMRSYLKDG